ncbi:MAG TPA: Xaa-Pro peptidase family protein [Bacteroidales bacterium]|nr:Xaa-Pro peptidase family protein [Bacteroidales bacterium]
MTEELSIRLAKIREQLIISGVDACLLTTTVNILYANGSIFNGYYYIPSEGKPIRFVKRPVGLEGQDIRYIRKPEQIPDLLKESGLALPEKLMLEGDEISHGDWMRLQACFIGVELVNGTNDLRKVRSIKTDFEVSLIRRSAEAHVRVYKRIPEVYRPGMTDHSFSIEIERLMRLEGNLGLFRTFGDMEAFMGSVLTGDNASVASPYDFALGGAGTVSNPIGAAGLTLMPGKSIMIDMAGNFTGYLDDLTRTFSIGKLTEKAYKAHQVSIDIQQRLMEEMKENAVCEDLWDLSLKMATDAGLADCYMGTAQQAKFVGHGVGIVINELPVIATRSRELLKANMTIAIEPKFVIEGVGAVGVEDTFLIQKNGSERLTKIDYDIVDLTN